MDLEVVRAVLELILDIDGGRGKLARLADRHEPGAERERQGCTEDEPPGLGRGHDVNRAAGKGGGHQLDDRGKRLVMAQERGNVLEYNARLGEVGDIADNAAGVERLVLSHRSFVLCYGCAVDALIIAKRNGQGTNFHRLWSRFRGT